MTDRVHPFIAGAERLGVDLDELAKLDPTFLSLTDKRQGLLLVARASSRVRALEARVMACADDVADADGFRDVASWVAQRSQVSGASARRAQRLGVACEQRWHVLGQALVEGHASIDQGHVIVAALDEVWAAGRLVEATAGEWADVLTRAEAHLVEQAADFGPRALQRLGERILEVVAPQWVDQIEERRLRDAERAARRRTTLKVQGSVTGRRWSRRGCRSRWRCG